jgi:hypothetical protein
MLDFYNAAKPVRLFCVPISYFDLLILRNLNPDIKYHDFFLRASYVLIKGNKLLQSKHESTYHIRTAPSTV